MKDGAPVCDGEILVKTIDSNGKATGTYCYIDWAEDEEGNIVTAWADSKDQVTNLTFAPGQGLWVQAKSGYSLQTSGKVSVNDVIVTLGDGCVLTGNPFPVDINLTDIIALYDGDVVADGEILIKTLDSEGKATGTYCYIDWAENADGEMVTAWADSKDQVANAPIKAGMGLWVQAKLGYALRFPAPKGL